MKDIKKQMIAAELIQKELDGCLTDQEFNLLQSMLKEDKEAVEYYVKTIRAISAFSSNSIVPSLEPAEEGKYRVESFESGIWKALAEAEKKAPAVQVMQEKPAEEPIQKVERQNIQIRINRGSLITLLLSMAAVILFVLIIRFVPPKTGIGVATLTDSIKAKWADTDTAMGKGARLVTGSTGYLLREGIVQIEFDNQAKVTIESPAEFEIVTGDQVKLNYGRLYAAIPQSAIGFAVQTQSARIIDLGTEFGIDASTRGDTFLHVIKGKTTLIAGEKSHKTSMEVIEGAAKKISFLSKTVSDIHFEETLFVRTIDSGKNAIWRGQKEINLADIVGGGSGQGNGTLNAGINPLTGAYEKTTIHEDQEGDGRLRDVPGFPFIDSVFVPDQSRQGVRISSTGLVYTDFGDTNGKFWGKISNGSLIYLSHSDEDKNADKSDLVQQAMLKGQAYGTADRPGLMMHANMGITFDLDEIRKSYPNAQLRGFESTAGVPDQAWKGTVNVYVLVDGKRRFYQENLTREDAILHIVLPIENHERFLTLVVADCDKDNQLDWFQFGKPSIVLE